MLLLWTVVFYASAFQTPSSDVVHDEEDSTTKFPSTFETVDQFIRLLTGANPTPTPSASPISSGTVVHHDDHLSGVTHAPTSSSSSTTTDHHTDDGIHHGTDDTHGDVTTHHAEDDTHHGVTAHHTDDNHGAHASAHGEVHHSSVFGIITGESS